MENFEISVKRFDDFANEYAAKFMNTNSYEKHIEKFCELISTKNPSILELACGSGNVTKYLKQRFPQSQITAIDLAPEMINIAKKTVSDVDFRIMDVRNIKSLPQTFDSIMCSFCLPFLSKTDTEKLIADCSDKLNNNGTLYISTMEGDESKAGFETTSFSGNSEVYFNYHLQEDLENFLLKNGFTINYNIQQNYYNSDGSILIDLIIIAVKI